MKPGKRPRPFWLRKPLNQLSRREWESLCDGCGRCCVLKIEDPRTLKVEYTNVACRLLDLETCRCSSYRARKKRMPECLDLFRCKAEVYAWLPSSCAYRLLSEGYDLPPWHPLVSGDPHSTRKAGMSVRGHVIGEDDAGWLPGGIDWQAPGAAASTGTSRRSGPSGKPPGTA